MTEHPNAAPLRRGGRRAGAAPGARGGRTSGSASRRSSTSRGWRSCRPGHRLAGDEAIGIHELAGRARGSRWGPACRASPTSGRRPTRSAAIARGWGEGAHERRRRPPGRRLPGQRDHVDPVRAALLPRPGHRDGALRRRRPGHDGGDVPQRRRPAADRASSPARSTPSRRARPTSSPAPATCPRSSPPDLTARGRIGSGSSGERDRGPRPGAVAEERRAPGGAEHERQHVGGPQRPEVAVARGALAEGGSPRPAAPPRRP